VKGDDVASYRGAPRQEEIRVNNERVAETQKPSPEQVSVRASLNHFLRRIHLAMISFPSNFKGRDALNEKLPLNEELSLQS
jgi:hypothetical protein